MNLVLHFLSSLLLWAILRQLNIRGAFLGAALFCLHPVNVQSVAWIAQLKNTLSMLFFLLSAYWFLASELVPDDSRTRRTWLSLAAFVLAMLSKGSVAVLPGVLLLIGWWRDGSVSRRLVLRVLPFAAIAVGLTFVNIWFQHRMAGSIRDLSAVERLLGAGAAVWFYLSKALLPVNLAFVYPQWTVHASDVQWWLPISGVAAISAALFVSRRRARPRALLFAWMFFLLALVPVMGFTDVYFMKYSAVADHYEYIALIAVVTLVAAAVGSLKRPAVAAAAGGALITVCVALTAPESIYTQSRTLLSRRLPRILIVVLRNNLGVLLIDRGQRRSDHAPARSLAGESERLPTPIRTCAWPRRWMNRFAEALDDCASATHEPHIAGRPQKSGRRAHQSGEFAGQPELESSYLSAPAMRKRTTTWGICSWRPSTRVGAAAADEMARLLPRFGRAERRSAWRSAIWTTSLRPRSGSARR